MLDIREEIDPYLVNNRVQRIVPVRFFILTSRTFQRYNFRQDWIYCFIFLCTWSHFKKLARISWTVGIGQVVSTFFLNLIARALLRFLSLQNPEVTVDYSDSFQSCLQVGLTCNASLRVFWESAEFSKFYEKIEHSNIFFLKRMVKIRLNFSM